MGSPPLDKFRKKQSFKGGVTIAGSLEVTGRASLKGLVDLNGAITVNTPMAYRSSSSTTQFFGVTRIASGFATATVSTTIVKSNAWFSLTTNFRGTLNNSANPMVCVSTVGDGKFFTISTQDGVKNTDNMDVSWEIRVLG